MDTPSQIPFSTPLPPPTTPVPINDDEGDEQKLSDAQNGLGGRKREEREGEEDVPDLGWYIPVQRAKRIKWREGGFGVVEQDEMEKVDVGFRLALLQDQATTTYPPAPTAFTSYTDAIDRLLPYHIWQIHDEELLGGPSEKGGLKREIRERQDAENLVGRIRRVHDRFDRIRRKDAEPQRPTDLPHLINMINSSTSAIRENLIQVQERLKRVRAQWDILETERKAREERIAKAQAEALARVEAAAKARIAPPAPTPTPAKPGDENLFGSERGKGRGRPRGRGRGRGGLRETVLTRTPSAQDASGAGNGSVSGSPGPSTPTPKASSNPAPNTPVPMTPTKMATPAGTTPASNALPLPSINTSEPVNISVSMSVIPQLVNLGLLGRAANGDGPKPPASVVGNTKDKKNVVLSLTLGACTPVQLQSLAKLLNAAAAAVKAEANGDGGGESSALAQNGSKGDEGG